MGRKASELIKGEDLNVLIGGLPYPDPELSGRFKLGILQLLNERYGLTEKDFVSAELEIVPAGPARDVGLDASMIGAYGQDDRVCAFPALVALTSLENPERTSVCLLFDKEEIGSDGNTGAQSRSYEYALQEIFLKSARRRAAQPGFPAVLENCQMLSADVSTALIRTFASVSDTQKQQLSRPRHLPGQICRLARQKRDQRCQRRIFRPHSPLVRPGEYSLADR